MVISAPIMNTHHPAHIDDSVNTPLIVPKQQVIPGYQYPFSLAPDKFPEVFYRLHRSENWTDTHSLPPTTSIPSKPYNPPEHGWSAKDTQTPLPSSPREILTLVRNHFSEKSSYASTPSNSIFVPGVWRAGKSSQVSLWDNKEDAREEGRRIGGVEIFEVGGEVLREGGSVMFCVEELLGRSSALCWVTRGRYGRVGSGRKGKKKGRGWGRGWGRGGRREGEGLRGKAYLVVGVIPGTHNLPHPTPIIPTPNSTNINHAFHTQNEEDDDIREDIARTPSSPSVSTHRRETPGTLGDFDFDFGLEQEQEQIQDTPLSQTPNPLPYTKNPSLHEIKYNPGVLNWTLDNPDVNNIEEYEIERDIRRHAQGMKRNSVFRKMEKISEDIGDGGVDEVGEEEEEEEEEEEMRGMDGGGIDGGGSRGWSWGDGGREREKYSNSKRRITSTARITRKGTFGERFREKSAVLQDEERVSLRGQSFTSREFDRSDSDSDGRGRAERARYIDTGTSICDRISCEEDSSEDGLSAGDIPAVAGAGVVAARKRGGGCEVSEMKDGCDDCAREEGGDRKSRGMGMRVRGKKSRREENDFEYERGKGREREEVSFGSRMSSFVGAVNDDKDIEEEEDLQHEDTDFDIETPEPEKLTHPQTTTRSITNSRIPIEYLKSRRPIPRKTISRGITRDTYLKNEKDTRRWENEKDGGETFDLVSEERVNDRGSGSGLESGAQGGCEYVSEIWSRRQVIKR
ncbi:hypothetical protein BCON_0026g00230 [Botryotinia convoluta]|uniref:Uncharacterized protein n=1 Tax=Botryotinia convoluta TaxID=54673 RepID=A0A4Z1IIU4_9HELO|nr:hypothetical protein BCON_0026g00230 [Botryotinia convoluta]